MKKMLKHIRSKVKRHPRLSKYLFPLYVNFLHLRWKIRNLITLHRPISFSAANINIKLYCNGQISENVYAGFEENERDFVSSYLRPGMCLIDVGANIGLYTVTASALVGKTGAVHAFEPSASTFKLLLRNIELNSCGNVILNKLALSDLNETMVLRADPLNPSYDGHRFVQKRSAVGTILETDEIIECTTLDAYASKLEIIDFMKVDVEGAELMVFKGSTKILERTDAPMIMFECNVNGDEVANFLSHYGYNFFLWDADNKILRPSSFKEAIGGNIFAKKANRF